jgi:toxin ParE1/3/4
MRLRWTAEAAADLEKITNYLFERTPENAERIVRSIYNTASKLTTFPLRGRAGKKHGTRELITTSLPHVIVYRVSSDVVYIARILHGAQKWP